MPKYSKRGQYHVTVSIGTTEVVVTRPTASSVWYIGADEAINWTDSRSGKAVISIIRDGGAEVTLTTTTGVTNTGYYIWRVTGPASASTQIRVTTPDGNDLSSAFAIEATVVDTLEVTAPVDDEVWKVGERHTISWDDLGHGTATIDISRDGGTTWSHLGTVPNAGYYNWVVTGPGSTTTFFRVTTPAGSDISGKVTLWQETIIPTGDTSLADLVTLVDRRLANYDQFYRQTEVGDGLSTYVKLHSENIIPESMAVSFADATSAAFGYSLDEEAGLLLMDSPAANEETFYLSYRYRLWSQEQVEEAINSAINELFGAFYRAGRSTITTDGSAEYAVSDENDIALTPEDRITRVEYWSDPNWVKLHSWSVRASSTEKFIHFETPKTSGYTLRVTYAKRPGTLPHSEATLEGDAGLPTRAKEPIVLMACSDLLQQRIAPRVQDDRAHVSQGQNPVKSYEIVNASQSFRARAELKASRLKMEPLWSRIVF